ncbi:L,D-transpeptidase [Amorphus orientalis]|uniref:Lipoprotein-anchoring transpeptidase ErfK/SrfK n=1 Tax=Amorphus orientalis TaxID=649198 RepID=A0AAE3VQS9_9HYPH|nr:L,D-transpeptidase [Amorphus orientalis]MDQ0316624.1 lipoprotein-anchoring transpeptidase ErfK/SrfK [Amorphus orientalis]
MTHFKIALTVALGLALAGPASAFESFQGTDRGDWLRYLNQKAEAERGLTLEERREQRRTQIAAVQAGGSAASFRLDPKFMPTTVDYAGPYSPGTIVIDTEDRYLYHVQAGNKARRYGVGVGRPGFEWAGTHRVTRKAEWPGWTPPPQMRKRQPDLPLHMEGGPDNPLGARAMYLGSTLYRIHGSNAPWTIGQAVSSGCIRMRNEDVIELYDQVNVGTRVVVTR